MADSPDPRVVVSKDGPYLVRGGLPMSQQVIGTDSEGECVCFEEGERYPDADGCSLCRCGASGAKPYCDGSHLDGFDGTETASKNVYSETVEPIEGPTLSLMDSRGICAEARFCHRAGGAWTLVLESDDPAKRDIVIEEAELCPSGRYTAVDGASGQVFEPELQASIGLIEDPALGVSGPIWVRGGVPVESEDGRKYEARNRVTLCRCGASANKPFCDGSHVRVRFRAEE